MKNERYRLVYRYVGREYLLCLLVAFTFFFFIFFVNQILLIAQKILVKNVSVTSVLKLVVLAVPQFLLYTFPFSSLTASAMVLGDFSTNGEILALRSSGISLKHVFVPICVLALGLSGITFFTADLWVPLSSRQYKDMYVELMKDLPTLELSSYGANTIGDRVLANGVADGSTVEKLVIFSTGERQKEAEVISSEKAKVSLKDPRAFIYSLDLTNPLIMTNDTQKRGIWNLAKAEEATLYLDFSGQIPSITDTTPSQLSISQLKKKAQEKKVDLDRDRFSKEWELQKSWTKLASDSTKEIISPKAFNTAWETYSQKENSEPISFYYQYYRAEMEKKIALSMACFLLVILTFPLSYLRLKHGRLIGFGVAMLSSVVYWYLLFFAQLNIFKSPLDPRYLIWAPDVILSVVGVVLLERAKR